MCVNYILYVLLGVYAYRQYLHPMISEALASEYLKKMKLNERYTKSYEQIEDLDQQKVYYERIVEDMCHKIALWHESCASRAAAQSDLYRQRSALLQAKRDKQLAHVQLQKVYAELVPAIVNRAQRELEKKYAHEDAAQKYLDETVALLDKELSL